MLGDLLSPGADMWMWRISQGTAHSEEMLHLLLLAPELGAPFYPPYLMAHHCSASLPAASATPNLPEAAALSAIPKYTGKIQPGR